MVSFIDDHRDVYGVEPICRVLPIAPSKYHAHAARRLDPPSVRREPPGLRRPQGLATDEPRGIPVARCTVARLMKQEGLRGVVRGRRIVGWRASRSATARRPRQNNAGGMNTSWRRSPPGSKHRASDEPGAVRPPASRPAEPYEGLRPVTAPADSLPTEASSRLEPDRSPIGAAAVRTVNGPGGSVADVPRTIDHRSSSSARVRASACAVRTRRSRGWRPTSDARRPVPAPLSREALP